MRLNEVMDGLNTLDLSEAEVEHIMELVVEFGTFKYHEGYNDHQINIEVNTSYGKAEDWSEQ